MVDINSFFIFGSNFSQVPVCVSNDKLEWDTNCRIVKGDYTGVELPIKFTQSSGKKWTDVLNPNSVSMYVVSERFIELLAENGVTGWKNYPIIIFDKEGKEVSGYTGFSVIGKCGKIDYSQSTIIEKRLVPEGPLGKYYKGLYIGLDKWDGSDFFLPEKNLGIIITSKAADVLKKSKFTNIRFENLTDIETPDFAIQITQ